MVQEFQDKIPQPLLLKLVEIATKQTNAGVETACATAEVIEGVSLFADFAKSL